MRQLKSRQMCQMRLRKNSRAKAVSYTHLLVDDEPWALVYLEKIVKWEDLGFRITGKFENSMEAFNQAVSDPPDVIFIDIRMPEMDGLSFMRKAVEAGLPCRFVVISGFAEFSYAQEAIRMGVVCDLSLIHIFPRNTA